MLGRRKFLAASAGAVAAVATGSMPARADTKSGTLAILGGEAVRKNKSWPRWPHVDEAVVDSVVKTTKSGIWCRIQSASGTVPTFEKKFAEMEGAKLCVCTGSGTQALHTSVEALGIGPGDEIITSPYTDPGTVASILAARALPVLADLDAESYQLDPDDVERRITKFTKAIMPVHMMGQPCDMARIMEIAKKHNLKVIEDACQGALAVYQGKSWVPSATWAALVSKPAKPSPVVKAARSWETTNSLWTNATPCKTTAPRGEAAPKWRGRSTA